MSISSAGPLKVFAQDSPGKITTCPLNAETLNELGHRWGGWPFHRTAVEWKKDTA